MLQKSTLFFLFTLTASISAYSQARAHQIDVDQEKCLSVKHGTMPRAKCYSNAFDAWEKDVKDTYTLLKAKLPPAKAKALDASQSEWERYRDSEFEFIGVQYGDKKGTGYIAPRIIARIEIVKSRALLLEDRLAAF